MKDSKWFRSGLVLTASLGMLLAASPAAMADSSSGTSSGTTSTQAATTWKVDTGAMSKDGVMAMAFFPNVITVDAGDTVNFTGAEHTVTFPGSDGKVPSATDPAAQMPAGGSTYDGTAFTNSGILDGQKPYTLQFTKPGVYPYYCLLHPGMMGVVIVNPAGTAYPMTQADYDAQSLKEIQADYTAGENAAGQFQLKTTKNADGTTTYHAQIDAPESQAYSFDLGSANNSSVTGSALIAFSAPPSPATNLKVTYSVTVKLKGLTPGVTYTAKLSEGKSNSGVAVPDSKFASVTVNQDGSGTATGTVMATGIPQGIWNLDIYDANNHVVSTGLVNQSSFAYERFLPGNLKVHVGDTVVWTQVGPNEAHTVTFLPRDWEDIPNESLMPVPYGSHTYAGTGFLNSGFLFPGQSYSLTFLKTGHFQYICLLHDVMGMIASVDVLPTTAQSTLAWNDHVTNAPSKVYHGTTYLPLWYVQQLLKNGGVSSSWNGQSFKATSATAPAPSTNNHPGGGADHIYLNNHLVQNFDGMVWADPSTGHDTTWLPLYDLNLALKSFGLNGSWDGNTWDLSPMAHAGSVPNVPSESASSTSSAPGNSGSSSGNSSNHSSEGSGSGSSGSMSMNS
jgi:plastocyanin